MATYFPEDLQKVLQAVQEGESIYEVERQVLGASHADLGAYLLELWGLPYELVEMVACHHDPLVESDNVAPVKALQLAEMKVAETRPKTDLLWEG